MAERPWALTLLLPDYRSLMPLSRRRTGDRPYWMLQYDGSGVQGQGTGHISRKLFTFFKLRFNIQTIKCMKNTHLKCPTQKSFTFVDTYMPTSQLKTENISSTLEVSLMFLPSQYPFSLHPCLPHMKVNTILISFNVHFLYLAPFVQNDLWEGLP